MIGPFHRGEDRESNDENPNNNTGKPGDSSSGQSSSGNRPSENVPSQKGGDSDPVDFSKGPEQVPYLPKGVYNTDSFYDRFTAHFSPKRVRLKPEVMDQVEAFDERLASVCQTVVEDYPDAEIQKRISNFQHSPGKGIFRIIEINDSDGAYYVPTLEGLNGEPMDKAEQFTRGEVRIVHQVIASMVQEGDLKVRNRVEAYFDKESLLEAVDHMRDAMILEQRTEEEYIRDHQYSYLKEQMGEFVLKGIAGLGKEAIDSLMEDGEMTVHLLDLDTQALPNGVVLRMVMTADRPGRFLYSQFRLTLNTVGKLAIEELSTELV